MKIVFATHNPGKLREMKQILSGLNVEFLSAEAAGVSEDVEENGKTFAENALKKAKYVAEKTGEWSMADDSGLCVDALNGAPGILTARWAGENASGKDMVEYTLRKMKDVPKEKRQAYFVSCVALVSPKGDQRLFEGKVDGMISLEPKGKALPKLPYDVIFIPEGFDKTFAEMDEEEKNKLSHRGKAFRELKIFVEKMLD